MYYSCFIGQEVGYYFISTKKKHFSISLGFHPLQRILVVTWEMEKKTSRLRWNIMQSTEWCYKKYVLREALSHSVKTWGLLGSKLKTNTVKQSSLFFWFAAISFEMIVLSILDSSIILLQEEEKRLWLLLLLRVKRFFR